MTQKIRTTIEPEKEIEVSDREAESLEHLGLIYTGKPPAAAKKRAKKTTTPAAAAEETVPATGEADEKEAGNGR